MSTNPYTYYEDKPLEKTAPRLSVSDDGEPEPDYEPRFPIEFSAKYVIPLRLAVKSYPFVVTQHSLSFRSPDGKQVEIPRAEASKRVHFGPRKFRIDMEPHIFLEFVYDRKKDFELVMARLKIWGLQITDPEEAYRTVRRNLYQQVIGVGFIVLLLVLLLLPSLFMLHFINVTDGHDESLMIYLLAMFAKLFRWGTILASLICIPFLISRSSWTKNILLMLVLLIAISTILYTTLVFVVFPIQHFPVIGTDFYLLSYLLQKFLTLRRLERRLQRENEKLSWE